MLSEIETGKFQFSTDLEEIHMNVEARLAEIIGEAAGRLHTARSRNDQVGIVRLNQVGRSNSPNLITEWAKFIILFSK